MIREANFHQSQLFMKYHTSQSENSIRVTEALQRRIQWETTHRMEKEEQQKPRESSEGRIWRGNQSWLLWVWIIFIFISLSVVHTHTKKKMMRKISLLCKLSRFGSCCLPEDEWKSSIACADWDDEHVEFSGFLFCPEIAGLHSCRWWQPWIETNEREILRDIERDRETGRQREIEREREYERIKII